MLQGMSATKDHLEKQVACIAHKLWLNTVLFLLIGIAALVLIVSIT